METIITYESQYTGEVVDQPFPDLESAARAAMELHKATGQTVWIHEEDKSCTS